MINKHIIQLLHLLQLTSFIWLKFLVSTKTYIITSIIHCILLIVSWYIFDGKCILVLLEKDYKDNSNHKVEDNFIYRIFEFFGVKLNVTKDKYNKILHLIVYIMLLVYSYIYLFN
jgi:dolichol kinase